MNVSLIRQRYLTALDEGKTVAEATAFANGLHIPARTPGTIAAPSKPADVENADPDHDLAEHLKTVSGGLSPVLVDADGAVIDLIDNPKGEPVEIPADWASLQWMKQEKLAAEIVGATVPLATAEGQTRAQKAKAIIEAEVAERASKG